MLLAFQKNLLGVWVSVTKNNIGWFASSFTHTNFNSHILPDIVIAGKRWFLSVCQKAPIMQVLLFFHNSSECDVVIKSKPILSDFLTMAWDR